MSSVVRAIGPSGAAIYLPNRPHPLVTIVNQGPDIAYLSSDDIPRDPWNEAHPLRVQSTIQWGEDQALYVASPTEGTTIVITQNAGQVFDASAIAGQILSQGLGANIAQQISLAGVPQIDAAESIVFQTFLTAGAGGAGGSTGGGGGSGGTGGTGGSTGGTGGTGGSSGGSPTGFIPGGSYGDGVTFEQMNAWLDSHDMGAVATWSDNSVATQQAGYSLGTGERHGPETASGQGIVNLACGGIFSGDSWGAAAAGSYDGRWTVALQNIKAKWGTRDPAKLHIRFAHEYNGSFSAWAVSAGNASNFVTAFRRFAILQRQIIPGSVSCWSPNYGTSSGATLESTWPGADYVDVVGPDWYNNWPHATTAADFNSNLIYAPGGNPQGLGSWLAYAAAKGKPMCLPEFGNPAVNGDGGGGGEAPGWATAFIQWCRTNGGNGPGKIWYACYFNISGGYPNRFAIYGDQAVQPSTAAVFKAAW